MTGPDRGPAELAGQLHDLFRDPYTVTEQRRLELAVDYPIGARLKLDQPWPISGTITAHTATGITVEWPGGKAVVSWWALDHARIDRQ